jgi:hypothetical protein
MRNRRGSTELDPGGRKVASPSFANLCKSPPTSNAIEKTGIPSMKPAVGFRLQIDGEVAGAWFGIDALQTKYAEVEYLAGGSL